MPRLHGSNGLRAPSHFQRFRRQTNIQFGSASDGIDFQNFPIKVHIEKKEKEEKKIIKNKKMGEMS